MELEEFKEKIEHYNKIQLNIEGNLLQYIEDQVKDTYSYYRSLLFINFIFKKDFKNDFESVLNACYETLGMIHFKIEEDLEKIASIKCLPVNKIEDYSRGKYTHSDLIELFKKITDLNSNYLKLDFLNQLVWSRFCLITYHCLHHNNYEEYVNLNLPEIVLEACLGKKINGEYNYLRVLTLAQEQLKDSIYISETR